jgi:nucleoside-diphosphate-sugar epimerase
MSRILVTGGSGFIGREVCRLAAERDHNVVSVARSGRPDWESNTEPAWADRVKWVSASVFEPQRWREHLENCDGVVHSIGVIEDSPKEGIVIERLNGDAAILTGLEAERAGVSSFSFVSASTTPPGAREAYLTAKRRAERELVELDLSVARLRPGPVYGEGNLHFSGLTNRLFRELGERKQVARRLGEIRPLPVEQVAAVALETALDPGREGPYDVPAIGGARLVPVRES